ncbi:MAG: PIN domain-containing protein [Pseudomonadota bacterium]|nr:PIN domain-containing protein [Pseudomonadota bacterium]
MFDTNIVIDALNGIVAADEEYCRYDRVYISVMTWMEIMIGTEEHDRLTAPFLHEYFITIPITQSIVEQAVIIRKRYPIRLPDALIQASAQVHRALLVTRSSGDFPTEYPNVRCPYQL